MHRAIYTSCPKARAIVHTHSPYTVAISISSEFRHVIEEAKIVVDTPAVISNRPSGSKALAEAVAREFKAGARAVVVRNHGVVAAGTSIHHTRAVVESLEEWSKILAVTRLFGGAKYFLRDD
jgi:L-fuculose-phosphate aldolase